MLRSGREAKAWSSSLGSEPDFSAASMVASFSVMGWPETGSQWRGRLASFLGGGLGGRDILGGVERVGWW